MLRTQSTYIDILRVRTMDVIGSLSSNVLVSFVSLASSSGVVQNSVKAELDSRHLFRSDPSALSSLSARHFHYDEHSTLLRPFDLCRAFAFGN